MGTLLIVSHTEHYSINGKIYGLNSTAREINTPEIFDKIYHVACLIDSALKNISHQNEKIEFVPIPLWKEIFEKFSVIYNAPKLFLQ